MNFGSILGGLSNLAGGAAAKQIADDSFTSQQANQQQIYDSIRKLGVPDAEALKISLALPKVVGQLNPQQQGTVQQGQSALGSISPDQTREAQLGALKQLQGLSQSGLSPADLAAMRQLQQKTEAQQQSNDAGLIQQMAQRGMGGGGSELALRALNSQQATNRLADQSDQVAQMAQARALQALSSAGNLAGNMRGQDYGEAANRAQATDAINRFNTMNQQNVAAQNTQASNQAQGFNVQNAQNIANAGTQTQNQQQMYNAQIPQLQFQDSLSKYGAMEEPANKLSSIEANRGKYNSDYAAGVGQAGGNMIQSLFHAHGGMVEPLCYSDGGLVYRNNNASNDSGDSGGMGDVMSKLAPLLMLMKNGGMIPGQALVPGDNIKNDMVPALLSPKEIVIPRSITMGKDAPLHAANFVHHELQKRKA